MFEVAACDTPVVISSTTHKKYESMDTYEICGIAATRTGRYLKGGASPALCWLYTARREASLLPGHAAQQVDVQLSKLDYGQLAFSSNAKKSAV